ncbi:MAG: AIR synthase family protein [Chloroflexi bacterium]|nr:AIR synthase family protein [Chloroflexota bacterium]
MTEDLSDRRLKAGKLPADILASFLKDTETSDRRVLLGPGVGEDAAFVSFGSTTLIAKTDPVTFATDRIGWYVVHVNANDIAASGGVPKWFLATLLLPENEPASTARDIFDQIRQAATELGISLIGGHTEITVGLPRPIISGTMLGEAPPSETLKTSSARPGNDLILTAGIAIEGTAIIARESKSQLLAAGLTESEVASAVMLLDTPGISVVKAARVAAATGYVTAMHDPTEGGLAGALHEMTRASSTGITVGVERVNVLPETTLVCNALDLDPWGLIASGSLLIASVEEGSAKIVSELHRNGISASVIGKFSEPGSGLLRTVNGVAKPLPLFERDEIARLYGA